MTGDMNKWVILWRSGNSMICQFSYFLHVFLDKRACFKSMPVSLLSRKMGEKRAWFRRNILTYTNDFLQTKYPTGKLSMKLFCTNSLSISLSVFTWLHCFLAPPKKDAWAGFQKHQKPTCWDKTAPFFSVHQNLETEQQSKPSSRLLFLCVKSILNYYFSHG